MSPTREEQWKRWQKLRYLAPLRRRFVFCSRKSSQNLFTFWNTNVIAMLCKWSKIVPNFITQSELKPIVVRFAHFPALGTRSTSVILACFVLHCYAFWLVGKARGTLSANQKSKTKPTVARFTHFPALGTRSTPVILDFVVLHCYTFWLVKNISRYSIN